MKLKSGLYETDKYRCLGNLNNDSVDLRLIYCGYEDCAPGHRYDPNKRCAYLIHFYGRHYNEMHYERTPVRHETVSIGSRRGVSGHQHNTFAILAEQDTTEDYGACYGLSLMYSGIFLLEAEQDQYSQTRIQMGIADELLDYRLCPSECFYAPEVIMGYSQEGLAQLSHIFHHFLRENVCRGKYKKVRRPILVNNWEATYFSFTGKKLIDLGVYSFLEKLQTRYPDLLIEGCGSGGCRFDAGMMYYTPQIWTSDNTDAIERLSIQYGASFGYPVSVIGSHISAVPNHQNGRTTDIRTRGVVAMSGNFGYELDLTKLGSDEKEQIKKQIQVFKEDWQLIHNGSYYRCTDPRIHDEYFAWNMVSPDQSEALLNLVTTNTHGNSLPIYVKCKGLPANRLYYCRETQETYSGAVLKTIGIPVSSLSGEYQAFQFHLTLAE